MDETQAGQVLDLWGAPPEGPDPEYQQIDVGGEIVEFPSSMSDEDIAAAIQSNLPQPSTQAPEAPKKRYNDFDSALMGFSDMATMGTLDEIAGAVNALPALLDERDFKDRYQQTIANARKDIGQAQEENPMAFGAGQVGGAIVGTLAGGGALATRAPALTNFVAKQAGRNALTRATSAGAAGAVSGGVYGYGSGSGGAGERYEEAQKGGLVGLVVGPLGYGGARMATRAVGAGRNLAQRAKQAFGGAAESVPETGAVAASGRPLAQLPPVEELASKQGEIVRLPTGASTGDVNMMRAEEAARQGILGNEAQSLIGQVDNAFTGDVTDAVQSLGGGAKSSEELLMSGITQTRRSAEARKRLAARLIKARNDKIARASIYRGYVNDTLVPEIDALTQTPDFKVALAKSTSAPIKEEINILKGLVGGSGGKIQKPLDFAELSAWRTGLNGYKPGTPEGAMAGQLKQQYDNWLDNIAMEAFKNADDDLITQIAQSNKAYADFKAKTGTNRYRQQSAVLEKVLKESEITPGQLVNMTFGKTAKGSKDTAQTVGRMIEIVPEGPKREAMKQNLRMGLVQRVFEDSYDQGTEKVSMKKLKNNLLALKTNEAYKTHLATPEYTKVMDGLVRDIGKYIDATSRRDVYSPSGGAVVRYLDATLNGIGKLTGPMGGRTATEFLRMGVREAKTAKDRDLLERSLRQYSDLLGEHLSTPTYYYGAVAAPAIAGGNQTEGSPTQITVSPGASPYQQ